MAVSGSLGGRALRAGDPMEVVPDVTSSSPAIDRSAVDLPQPDGPTSTINSPSAMSRLRSSTPFTPPGYSLVTWSRTIWPIRAHLLCQVRLCRVRSGQVRFRQVQLRQV